MNLTVDQMLQFIRDGGILGLLVFILFAAYRRWWVTGRELDDYKQATEKVLADAMAQAGAALDAMRAERDEWKAMALRGIEANERALEVARLAQSYRPPPAAIAP